ncbi:AraC family transcriptional regulator [Superficieibacter electus]|uniref:AraC family transcriptional regulator n=1 Tax=Superficieibacter electus TaxID=2022662 RepID=A0A2P5GRY8_9ENTR|nr:AraC family transcriptional regulator [Superficieibacter electus]POP46023.1 AraC family transcriptional regulator [Superficieibacter electus]POP49330.1 AraC family transcriptional regulator [Superficieibacter electus]
MKDTKSGDWLDFRRDSESGIESVSAHFTGHAYDPHDHDEVLVGFTHQGVQRFRCHRTLHTSRPGRAILIEPGAVHDGHAPETGGFTYSMLYLPQSWVSDRLAQRGLADISLIEAAFRHTLTDDETLFYAIQQTFFAFHHREGKLARDQSMDRLLSLLTRHIKAPPASYKSDTMLLMHRIREILHERMADDIGLDELSSLAGIDRFRLSRQFYKAFGQTPHAWLVRLRLRSARALLAHGQEPALVAAQVGFADQSHLGRWFQRAYRMSPAAFQQQCTNVLSR